jgi:hypothetical protein
VIKQQETKHSTKGFQNNNEKKLKETNYMKNKINYKTKNPNIKEIHLGQIQISHWDPADGKMFSWDYYYNPNDSFHDESCKKDVAECDPGEVVLDPNTPYELIIDYPTSTPYRKRFNTCKNGMTRIQLADFICKHYRKMYAEEDGTSNIPGLLGCQGGEAPMLNRQQTDGKYGIWGHCIEDLVLISATVDTKNFITLGVDS